MDILYTKNMQCVLPWSGIRIGNKETCTCPYDCRGKWIQAGTDYCIPKNMFGKASESCGNILTRARTSNRGGRKIMTVLATFSTETSATPLNTKSTVPKGGVSVPITRFNMMTIPNWTGSIPKETTIGNRTGTSRLIDAIVSIKSPTINRSTLINRIIIQGDMLDCWTTIMSFCGICSRAKILENKAAEATMIKTCTEVTMDSLTAFMKLFRSISL